MKFKPEVITLDYETTGLDYHSPDFRIISCAISWYDREGAIKNLYTEGETKIHSILKQVASSHIPVIVHNFQFEYGVTKYRFPDLDINWHADTMRLAQVADNGGKQAKKDYDRQTLDELVNEDPDEDSKYSTGLSLQACISRFLPPEFHDHKAPFYEYLRNECGVKKGFEGANLHLLPFDLLRDYNTADTDNTLRLYSKLIEEFKRDKYDWRLDHQLYFSVARMIAESKGKGVRVDCERLRANLRAIESEIAEIWEVFSNRFRNEIRAIEESNLTKYVLNLKTERGQTNAWERAINDPQLYCFNLNSTKQKAELFVNQLGMVPKFFTEKGSPAFGKAFLSQWGEGGEMLKRRGTLLLAYKQMSNLLELASKDGRWHIDLNAVGTVTGRFSGGDKWSN